MRQLLFFLFFACVGLSFAQPQFSANCKADIDAIIKLTKQQSQKSTEKLLAHYPVYKFNGSYYLSLLAKVNANFNPLHLEEQGVLVGKRIKNSITLRYPIEALSTLYTAEGVDVFQVAGKIAPNLDRARYDTKVDSVHKGYALPSAYTGKDVLIGVTDWGFDYTHPMFYDTLLEQTRILAAWDQFKTSGPHPSGFDYGTEYSSSSALIEAGSDTANIYSYATHGTHVAGIAGGSGGGTAYRGIGFESEFLFVTFLVDEAAVLDAWAWMYEKSVAENKRLVVNMSWGLYHTGALDGTSILSEAMDNYSDLGVVFVTSAGNNGDVNFHVKKAFENDTIRTRINFYTGGLETLWGQSIHGWGDIGESFSSGIQLLNGSNDVLVETPWYSTATTDTYIDSFIVAEGGEDTIFYNLAMDAAYPSNDRPQMRMRIKKPTNPSLRIVLKSTATSGLVHFWNVTELVTDVGNWGMPFTGLALPDIVTGDNAYGIGAPACTYSAISVAAHAPSFETAGGTVVGGAGAPFSSNGPMMNDSLKPDISGPGVGIASSISSYTDNSYTPLTSISFEGRTYPFARFNGTSMSSPAVAGIVALILDANPYLATNQVKAILIETAREDTYTGTIPADGSTTWGWGKVNAYKAIQLALVTTGYNELAKPLDWLIYPNPSSTHIAIKNQPNDVQTISIYDLNGRLCKIITPFSASIDVSGLEKGTYILRMIRANKVEQRKFVIE